VFQLLLSIHADFQSNEKTGSRQKTRALILLLLACPTQRTCKNLFAISGFPPPRLTTGYPLPFQSEQAFSKVNHPSSALRAPSFPEETRPSRRRQESRNRKQAPTMLARILYRARPVFLLR
jgi:hypothetical protein